MSDRPAKVTPAERIAQYIAVREKIRETEAKHKEELKPLKAALGALEGVILAALKESGGDNLKVRGVGTAFTVTKQSASIGDKDAFRRHVIGEQAWDLLDWKANVTACAAFIDDPANAGYAPPGINFSTRIGLNVRTDSEGAASLADAE